MYYKESKTPRVAGRADPTWGVFTVARVEKIRKKGVREKTSAPLQVIPLRWDIYSRVRSRSSILISP